jgi:hypothetical protein
MKLFVSSISLFVRIQVEAQAFNYIFLGKSDVIKYPKELRI